MGELVLQQSEDVPQVIFVFEGNLGLDAEEIVAVLCFVDFVDYYN